MSPSEKKLAELLDRIQDLPEKATARAYTSYLVVVPHHDMTHEVCLALHEKFRDYGYAVDRITKTEVRGDEFRALVRPISGNVEGKGLKVHVLFKPTPEGLTPFQKQTLNQMMASMESSLMLVDEVIDY